MVTKIKRHVGDRKEYTDPQFLKVVSYQLKKLTEVSDGKKEYDDIRKSGDYWKVELYQTRENLEDADWTWLEDSENQSLLYWEAMPNSKLALLSAESDQFSRTVLQTSGKLLSKTKNEAIADWIERNVPDCRGKKKLLKHL